MKRDERMERRTTTEEHTEMQIDERKLYDEVGEDLDADFRDK
jgi:hypothetical protein